MLTGDESISHYTRSNVSIWMSMAFQAGVLNVGGFMACHRFVSHVTGFATFMGIEVSQSNFSRAAGMLAVPIFFLFGAMISGYLVDIRLKQHKSPKYFLSFGLIFALIFAVFLFGKMGYFGPFGIPLSRTRDYILLALLCLTCGIQNGTITSVSKSVVRTTHLTGITTDLGIGIMRYLNRNKIPGEIRDEERANLTRIGIIFCFGLGSIVGAIVFENYGYAGFLVPSATSGALFYLMYRFQAVG